MKGLCSGGQQTHREKAEEEAHPHWARVAHPHSPQVGLTRLTETQMATAQRFQVITAGYLQLYGMMSEKRTEGWARE